MSGRNDLSRTDIESLINEWVIGRNGERDRKIVRRRMIDGILFDALAAEFDLSLDQIKRIVYKRQKEIFKHID